MPDSDAGGNEVPKSPKSEDLFLPACPVCAMGKVVKDTSDSKEDRYSCTKCSSVLSETIFGFVYTSVDEKQHSDVQGLKNQTFTKQQLVKLSVEASETGKSAFRKKTDEPEGPAGVTARQQAVRRAMQKRATAAAEKTKSQEAPKTAAADPRAAPAAAGEAAPPEQPEPEGSATAVDESVGKELLRELRGDGADSAGDEDDGDDLWWEVDEEALARREKQQDR